MQLLLALGSQILTHYASGMCLVPADTNDGASMVLSTSCVSSPINQVYSTVSGWIQVNVGSRYLQPAAPVSNEGVIMVAKVSAPTEQYYYTPSPRRCPEVPGVFLLWPALLEHEEDTA